MEKIEKLERCEQVRLIHNAVKKFMFHDTHGLKEIPPKQRRKIIQ